MKNAEPCRSRAIAVRACHLEVERSEVFASPSKAAAWNRGSPRTGEVRSTRFLRRDGRARGARYPRLPCPRAMRSARRVVTASIRPSERFGTAVLGRRRGCRFGIAYAGCRGCGWPASISPDSAAVRPVSIQDAGRSTRGIDPLVPIHRTRNRAASASTAHARGWKSLLAARRAWRIPPRQPRGSASRPFERFALGSSPRPGPVGFSMRGRCGLLCADTVTDRGPTRKSVLSP